MAIPRVPLVLQAGHVACRLSASAHAKVRTSSRQSRHITDLFQPKNGHRSRQVYHPPLTSPRCNSGPWMILRRHRGVGTYIYSQLTSPHRVLTSVTLSQPLPLSSRADMWSRHRAAFLHADICRQPHAANSCRLSISYTCPVTSAGFPSRSRFEFSSPKALSGQT